MEDKKLNCSDCGQEFVFTAQEQEFYQEKGFTNEPKRCKQCRQQKKSMRSGGGGGGGRFGGRKEMHSATCADCGKETEVPFKPRGDKPVYCRDCYQTRR